MNEIDRRQLLAELAADREALLEVAYGVDDAALTLPTRNAEWAVRDVLAHVLASDADLIWLFEAAADPPSTPPQVTLEQHQQEMARWSGSTRDTFVQELGERASRWRALLDELPDSALAVQTWWKEGTLGDVVADWREHDRQHAEDIRLALEASHAGGDG